MKRKLNKQEVLTTILGIILLPITLPVGFILYIIIAIFRGDGISDEYVNHFIQKFMTEFNSDIKKFLNINSNPEIHISTQIQIFTPSNLLGEFTVPGIFDFGKFGVSSTTALSRSDKSRSYINIYYENIYRHCQNLSFLTKLTIIKTLIHELTHYKQYIENRFEGNHSSTFDEYLKESCEIEARKSSKRFTIKNIIKIIRFLIHN